MVKRDFFFATVRNEFGSLSQSQVDGFNAILAEWDVFSGSSDKRWLAYMLATAWHETDKTMKGIEEYGKGKGRPYGKPHPITNKIYYGRGLVQITWYENYLKMSKILYDDNRLVWDPDLALDLKVATKIMFEGMTTGKSFKGDFTNRHLGQYFNLKKDDPVGARWIVNGQDKAKKIATHHIKFLTAII